MDGGVYCIGGGVSSEASSPFPASSGVSSSGLCACAGLGFAFGGGDAPPAPLLVNSSWRGAPFGKSPTISTLYEVPFSSAVRTSRGAPGPKLPKTRSSPPSPSNFMPVADETWCKICARLELSALTVSSFPRAVTVAGAGGCSSRLGATVGGGGGAGSATATGVGFLLRFACASRDAWDGAVWAGVV